MVFFARMVHSRPSSASLSRCFIIPLVTVFTTVQLISGRNSFHLKNSFEYFSSHVFVFALFVVHNKEGM